MPGHSGGGGQKRDPTKPIAPPERHWPDQQPFLLDGPFEERLNHWLTLVQRGDVLEAYRVFLGLFAERERRPELLAHLAFAGLIDVQDRMLYNRSYTTGHKAHRARATIEIGEAVGWEAAHDVLYAGALDMDRKSTRLNSSHLVISYAVFCLKKKKTFLLSSRFASSASQDRRRTG